MISSWIRSPWAWCVSGPAIGLFVPLLLLGNKQLGMTGALRAMCAAIRCARGHVDVWVFATSITTLSSDWR